MAGSPRARVMTSVLAVASLTALASLAASCGPDDPAAAPEVSPVAAITSYVPAPTTTRPLDPLVVEACVEYVQFGAYTQDPALTAMWTDAGLDVDRLRANCEALGMRDRAALRTLAADWARVQTALAAERLTTSTTRATSTGATTAVTTPRASVPATATTTASTPDPASPVACGPDESLGPDGMCVANPTVTPAPPATPAPTPAPAPAPAPEPTA